MTAVQPEIETRAATKPLRLPTFREQYWLLVALLALLAYAPSLGAGFVSDDLVLLYQARSTGFEPQVFIPPQNFFLYRPLGSLLIWQLGWALWGHNPLPFHLISLALHASVSLLLGLWLARSTARPWLGWLAGALFAVMPLHLEAVAWIAAQWDLLSMFFVMLSLYLFTGWWLRDRAVAREERSTEDDRSPAPEVGSRRVSTSFVPYAFAVLLYGAAIFTKESLLAFLPVFGVAAWLASRRMSRVAWLRLALALVPFAGMLALNVGIRLVRWGHLGGYARTRAEFLDLLPVFWNHLSDFARVLLSPINSMVLGTPISQTVGAISALALLAWLVLY